jgi:hypothetical protein
MKSKLLIIITLSLFIISSCKKEKRKEEELPAITDNGANTFGCILDNRVFASRQKCKYTFVVDSSVPCVYASIYKYRPPFNSFTELNIEVKNKYFIDEEEVRLNLMTEVDTVTLKSTIIHQASLTFKRKNSSTNFELDFSKNNEFNASISDAKVSGNFTLYFKNINGETKVMSNGRFDVSFY